MIVMMMAMTPSLNASSRLVLMAPVWRQRLLEDHADASFREAASMYGCEVRAPRHRGSPIGPACCPGTTVRGAQSPPFGRSGATSVGHRPASPAGAARGRPAAE